MKKKKIVDVTTLPMLSSRSSKRESPESGLRAARARSVQPNEDGINITGLHIFDAPLHGSVVDQATAVTVALEIGGKWVEIVTERVSADETLSHIVEVAGIEKAMKECKALSSTVRTKRSKFL